MADVNDAFPTDPLEWTDTDGDLIGNNADLDDDGDGMPDSFEGVYGLDPLSDDAGWDNDGDGLTNLQEYQQGTDPTKIDTDGDGMPDGYEAGYGFDPTNAADAGDDLDGDGRTNLEEYQQGSNPLVSDLVGQSIYEYGLTRRIGGSSRDYGNGVATDASGNIYTTGYFGATMDFDDSSGDDTITNNGGYDAFLTKHNADGSYGWTRTFGGTSTEYGYDVATDSAGNVYVVGIFYSATVDFDAQGAGDVKSLVSGYDAFLTRINADGSYGWTQTYDTASTIMGLRIDGNNNIYLRNGSVLSVLDQTGAEQWSTTIPMTIQDIAIADNGNIYITGSFSGTVDFDPGAGVDNHTSAGGMDVFVTVLNPGGSYLGTWTFGGTSTDNGRGIDVDNTGNVYIAGTYSGTADFDPGAGVTEYTSQGGTDAFVVKLGTDGSFGWAQVYGGTSTVGAYYVQVGQFGDVLVGGTFYGTADFDPGAGVTSFASVSSTQDIYVTKFAADGSWGWARTIGAYRDDTLKSMEVGANGSIYLVGDFNGTTYDYYYNSKAMDFDPGPETDIINAYIYQDAYVSRWDFYADTDGDGVADVNDAFPNDPYQQ